jgi:hypothetical protein
MAVNIRRMLAATEKIVQALQIVMDEPPKPTKKKQLKPKPPKGKKR